MSGGDLEQRINIKFCVKTGKSATETVAVLKQAYGKHSMKKSTIFKWHKRFKEGREDVHDDPRCGQPKTQRTAENVDRVRALIHSDQRLSLRMVAEELKMNRETVRQIVAEDLGMRKTVSRAAKETEEENQAAKKLTTESTKGCQGDRRKIRQPRN